MLPYAPPVDTGNSFLDSLALPTRTQLLPLLTHVSMTHGQVLGEAETPVETVYFPTTCVISTVALMADGRAVEVGFTGHDGFSSLAVAFHSKVDLHTSIVQIANYAYSVGAAKFARLIESDTHLRERIAAYAEYSYLAATQFAACNGLHSIEERYARWILMAYDRVGPDEYLLTQDFIAQMLGVRRPSVSLVAGTMSKAGIISYNRGRIRVLDHAALEDAVCECYRVLSHGMKRLMGYESRKHDKQTSRIQKERPPL